MKTNAKYVKKEIPWHYVPSFCMATLASIGDTDHNISLRLFEQLILDLDVKVEVLDLLKRFPSGVVVG